MTVQPEDLMEMVITADALRNPQVEQTLSRRYPRWKRALIEPPFNAIGAVLGQLLAWTPWPWRAAADQQISIWLGARPQAAPAEYNARREELVAMTRRLEKESGRRPAVFILTSHPPTIGPQEWLRFELVREGLALGNAVIDAHAPGLYPPAPRCFLAIDPYALDTVSRPVGGLYGGFMHRIYLVWDRQSGTQSWLQRHLLLRGTGYPRIAWRLFASLRRGAPVVMVWGGGLPANARLFYAAREFVLRLPVERWPYSIRTAQQKWLQVVIDRADGRRPYADGLLPAATRDRLVALLTEWGIPGEKHTQLITDFSVEFAQTVPNRERLFSILLDRIVRRGQPLVLMPIAHQDRQPFIRIAPPWGLSLNPDGQLQLLQGLSGPSQAAPDSAALARRFAAGFTFDA